MEEQADIGVEESLIDCSRAVVTDMASIIRANWSCGWGVNEDKLSKEQERNQKDRKFGAILKQSLKEVSDYALAKSCLLHCTIDLCSPKADGARIIGEGSVSRGQKMSTVRIVGKDFRFSFERRPGPR